MERMIAGEVRWMHVRARVVRDDDGYPRRLYGANVDVTDRKRAEERLCASERLYRAIGESIDHGVWVCDASGRNVYTSESLLRLIGITQEECSGLGWTRALHPDEAEATREAWERCVAHIGGGSPIRDDAGQITAWAGINLEVDAFKRAQEALREAGDPQPYLVALTGYGRPEDVERARDAGLPRARDEAVEPASLARVLTEASASREGAGRTEGAVPAAAPD